VKVNRFDASRNVYLRLIFVSGFASIRNIQRGSRYVQTLVKVFMTEAHNSDVLSMLTKVTIFSLKVYLQFYYLMRGYFFFFCSFVGLLLCWILAVVWK